MRYRLGLLAFLILIFPASSSSADDRFTGPWKMEALKQPPTASISKTATDSNISEVYYDNVPLSGKPTRVFAYYAVPKSGDGPFPAMVLLHGGGGKAFREWATLWADRGYAAIAMDLSGRGPDGQRLPDAGPDQTDADKIREFTPAEVDQLWPYHAVAAAVRAHSFLVSRPEVDKSRIGLTGISWGGYLACIVAGIDDRLKVAVPVYGCGFLVENSFWITTRFKKLGPDRSKQWADLFFPSRYLSEVTCPILFVNGTNDFAYPLDSYQKSYELVKKAPVDLCVTVKMPHGHGEGWSPKEIGLFVDSVLKTGTLPPPHFEKPQLDDQGQFLANFTSRQPVKSPKLHYSTDTGRWQDRNWTTIDAGLKGHQVAVSLPAGRPIVAFVTIETDKGAISSSPHITLEK